MSFSITHKRFLIESATPALYRRSELMQLSNVCRLEANQLLEAYGNNSRKLPKDSQNCHDWEYEEHLSSTISLRRCILHGLNGVSRLSLYTTHTEETGQCGRADQFAC